MFFTQSSGTAKAVPLQNVASKMFFARSIGIAEAVLFQKRCCNKL